MNNLLHNVSSEKKRLVIGNIATQTGYSVYAIEKDWWVTMVLKAIFNTKC